MNILTGYLLVTGGLTGGLRVVRGVVRGAGRALAGDARGALAEAAGGLIAPGAQVSREARLLVTDALEAAQALTDGGEREESDPTRSVAEIVNRLKGFSSRHLRREFASLRSRLPCLWSRSYYAGTVGAVSESAIRRYIESQKGK